MQRHKLPIGIQTFREIRETGCYYVDKTPWIADLVAGKAYFLSRPRRFGKSLLLDTIAELFAGAEELFRGLAIHGDWDWSARHPVVRIDFARGSYREVEGAGSLRATLEAKLANLEEQRGVPGCRQPIPERFGRLLRAVRERHGKRVVVLVDEYDKPIVDVLSDAETARANRDTLREFYGSIKASDADLRFVMLTGVSKFARVNLFSGLNNLEDITLDPAYSAVCGYTERDLDEVFAPELADLDREEMRDWYNGYSWGGAERVYNPFGVLLLFRKRQFRAHWFETATPTFLIDHLERHGVGPLDLDRMTVGEDLLSSFDVEAIAPEALLFQTGYLTILDEEHKAGQTWYKLGYPNREVRQSLNRYWADRMAGRSGGSGRLHLDLWRALTEGDLDALAQQVRSLFAAIPYEWHTRNPIANYEGYYASVLYPHLAGLGFDVRAEDHASQGRVDLALRTADRIYLFELKVGDADAPTGKALLQLEQSDYADRYRSEGVPIHLVGVEFSRSTRNVVTVEVAPVGKQ